LKVRKKKRNKAQVKTSSSIISISKESPRQSYLSSHLDKEFHYKYPSTNQTNFHPIFTLVELNSYYLTASISYNAYSSLDFFSHFHFGIVIVIAQINEKGRIDYIII